MSVIDDIKAERQRQIEVEGWTPEHDDRHHTPTMAFDAALPRAAATYALFAALPDNHRRHIDEALQGLGKHFGLTHPVMDMWPRAWGRFKPKDRRRDLVRAGALIVAEIERLDRIAARSATTD